MIGEVGCLRRHDSCGEELQYGCSGGTRTCLPETQRPQGAGSSFLARTQEAWPASQASDRGRREGRGSGPLGYSHSIVPGGLDVMSKTTRFTSRSSLIMREAIVSSKS
jgi:hypothetical protein